MDSSSGKLVLSGTEYLALPQKKRQWIIEPLIPAGGIVNLYGKPKTGKSFASMGMGLAVANGEMEWNGFAVKNHGPVLTIQIDTPEGEMFDRIQSMDKAGYDVSKMFFADLDIAPYPFNILLPKHQAWLRQQVEYVKPLLVIIDTIRESHEGDENDSTVMKKVVSSLVAQCRPASLTFKPAIALISHSRKDSQFTTAGGDQDIMDEGRGTSYIAGRMDTIMRFSGNPYKTKGYMTYKGRSKGADGKLPLVGDKETGLLFIEGRRAEEDHLVMAALSNDELKSIHAKALWVAERSKMSISTATRRLNDYKDLGLPKAA